MATRPTSKPLFTRSPLALRGAAGDHLGVGGSRAPGRSKSRSAPCTRPSFSLELLADLGPVGVDRVRERGCHIDRAEVLAPRVREREPGDVDAGVRVQRRRRLELARVERGRGGDDLHRRAGCDGFLGRPCYATGPRLALRKLGERLLVPDRVRARTPAPMPWLEPLRVGSIANDRPADRSPGLRRSRLAALIRCDSLSLRIERERDVRPFPVRSPRADRSGSRTRSGRRKAGRSPRARSPVRSDVHQRSANRVAEERARGVVADEDALVRVFSSTPGGIRLGDEDAVRGSDRPTFDLLLLDDQAAVSRSAIRARSVLKHRPARGEHRPGPVKRSRITA